MTQASDVALDAAALRNWMLVSKNRLGARRAEIDALNVFPVPDGDTGTNMYLTVEAAAVAACEVADPADVPGPMADAIARGALLGARGNSGVILSQLLRGLADILRQADEPSGDTVAMALGRAADLAYAAVSRPVEGTVLTVARAAADSASATAASSVAQVVRAAAEGAREALAKTPSQLPALADAGVVDAGGKGLVVVLDGLVEVLTGEAHVDDVSDELIVAHEPMPHGEYSGPRYEVMYLLDAEDVGIPALRSRARRAGGLPGRRGWRGPVERARPHRLHRSGGGGWDRCRPPAPHRRHRPDRATTSPAARDHPGGGRRGTRTGSRRTAGGIRCRGGPHSAPRQAQHARLRTGGHGQRRPRGVAAAVRRRLDAGGQGRRRVPARRRHPGGCRAQPFDRADAVRGGCARCVRRLRRRRGDHGPGIQCDPLRRGHRSQQGSHHDRRAVPGGRRSGAGRRGHRGDRRCRRRRGVCASSTGCAAAPRSW